MTPGGPTDDDLGGEPIAELRDLGGAPSPRFTARLRGRIERREMTSQFLWVIWEVPVAVLLEFLELIFGLLGPDRSDKEDSRD